MNELVHILRTLNVDNETATEIIETLSYEDIADPENYQSETYEDY